MIQNLNGTGQLVQIIFHLTVKTKLIHKSHEEVSYIYIDKT